MHQLSSLELAVALAPLTERMAVDVVIPYLPPVFIVTFVVVVATGEVIVVLLHHLPMVFAVAALVVGQLWAAAVSAWPLRFHGHSGSPRFRATKNLRRDCSPWRSFSIFLSCYHFSTLG